MSQRCNWCGEDPLYVEYHDNEWGVPNTNEQKLFESMILESFQSGLSWITILRKREGFRRAFDHFDPKKIANYDQKKIDELLQNSEIIRNRLKIQATITNAKALLQLHESGKSLVSLIWSVTENKILQPGYKQMSGLPSKTEESIRLAKLLKANGFSFMGPSVCLAFMQANGLTNDHINGCIKFESASKLDRIIL